jgi:DNA-binding HxlR family transcriptional regulator
MPHDATPTCCPLYHEAVELIGRRWTGAILEILLQGGAMRFGEIVAAVPELSERMLSDRLKELEARGLVERRDDAGPPPHTRYALTAMGESLEPALGALKAWAREWLSDDVARFAPAGRD